MPPTTAVGQRPGSDAVGEQEPDESGLLHGERRRTPAQEPAAARPSDDLPADAFMYQSPTVDPASATSRVALLTPGRSATSGQTPAARLGASSILLARWVRSRPSTPPPWSPPRAGRRPRGRLAGRPRADRRDGHRRLVVNSKSLPSSRETRASPNATDGVSTPPPEGSSSSANDRPAWPSMIAVPE